MKTVLLIEDDSVVQLHGIEVLNSMGFGRNNIFTASDGLEAFHFLQHYSTTHGVLPDVILLDLVMPRADGFAFLETSKKLEGIKNTTIIIVSDSIDPADIDHAAKFNVFLYTTKPLRAETLANLLHLNNSQEHASRL